MNLDALSVMKPKMVQIGDAYFRRMDQKADGKLFVYTDILPNRRSKHTLKNNPNSQNFNIESNKKIYRIDELENKEINENDIENNEALSNLQSDKSIIKHINNDLILKVHVPSHIFPLIIGKRQMKKDKIQENFSVLLKIPTHNELKKQKNSDENDFIQICGQNEQNILKCRNFIEGFVQTDRNRSRVNYFVSIPFGEDETIKSRFGEFKRLVLSDLNLSATRGISEEWFQKDIRFHLTLRVLYLADGYEEKIACQKLNSLKTSVIEKLLQGKPDKEPIKLHIKGLDIMNYDPSEAKILFAKVTEVGDGQYFKQIINSVYDCFEPLSKDKGYDNSDNDCKIKIHATILNSKYYDIAMDCESKNVSNHNQRRNQKRISSTMDVSAILDKYHDYDFGTVTFNHMKISSMKHDSKTENYKTLCKIDF